MSNPALAPQWATECEPEMSEPAPLLKLPPIEHAAALLAEDVPAPPELLKGILHQGSKLILGSSSKARKTWVLIDLALSVASGSPFWKWPTVRGRVLYINFEIQRPFIRSRIIAVAAAKVITDISLLDVWNLRGKAAALGDLLPELLQRIRAAGYVLVIIDPIYKGLGGRDENRAGDISELCNELERIAVESGAAVAFAAHFSKGNQSAKESMDRIGGSGVFARDADAIVTLTKHQQEDALTAELILRNFPEQPPFVVKWEYPLMRVADDLDPAALKQPHGKTAKTRPTGDEVLALFRESLERPRAGLMTALELRSAFRARGWQDDAAPAMRDTLEGEGRLRVWHGPHRIMLAGLPATVAAYELQQANAGTVLEQPALPTKPAKKRKR